MNLVLRLALCAVVVAVAGIGLDIAHPGCLNNLGSELGSLPGLRSSIREEIDKQNDLQERCKIVLARLDAKRNIAAAVIAERLSLWEAAERFRDLANAAAAQNGQPPQKLVSYAVDEHICREVIACVNAELWDQPELAAVVGARLERELQEELECESGCLMKCP